MNKLCMHAAVKCLKYAMTNLVHEHVMCEQIMMMHAAVKCLKQAMTVTKRMST